MKKKSKYPYSEDLAIFIKLVGPDKLIEVRLVDINTWDHVWWKLYPLGTGFKTICGETFETNKIPKGEKLLINGTPEDFNEIQRQWLLAHFK